MAELAPEPGEDICMKCLVVSATFFPSCGLALGSGELIRRPAADRAPASKHRSRKAC